MIRNCGGGGMCHRINKIVTMTGRQIKAWKIQYMCREVRAITFKIHVSFNWKTVPTYLRERNRVSF